MSRTAIAKQIRSDPDQFADLYRDIRAQFKKGKPLRVTLKHVRMGAGGEGGDSDVSNWDSEHFTDLDPDTFAEEVVTDVTEDSKIFPATKLQRYALFFFRKNLQTCDRRIFMTIKGGMGDAGGDVFASEEANEAGRTSQIMRHDEAFVRLTLHALEKTLESKDKQLDRAQQVVDRLMDQFVPTLTAVQSILDRTAERDFKLERDKKLYNLLDQGGEKLLSMAPFFVASQVEKKNPQLAAMIRQSAQNPAHEILKVLMADVDAHPEKGQALLAVVGSLPHGPAILQALIQLAQQEKAAQTNAASSNEDTQPKAE